MPNRFNHQGSALAREIEVDDAERRREARYPTQDPAELEILPGPNAPLFGTVLDVSRSGLRVALHERISRGEQVMVKLHRNVIFGEVRYCRRVQDGFHVGVKIENLIRPPGGQDEHVADDSLSLYAVGKGLLVTEVIDVRQHLAQCEVCRARLTEKEDILSSGANPRGRLHLRPRD